MALFLKRFTKRKNISATTRAEGGARRALVGEEASVKPTPLPPPPERQNTPIPLSPVLALDRGVDVRLTLAARLVALLPRLSEERHSQLYSYVVQALGTLALDEVLKIRLALSSTLKDHACTPPKVAGQLARDIERDVSEPILRYCAAVSDGDLLDILRAHPASWVLQAIAGRALVSAPLSAAVIAQEDIPSGTTLITNTGARMDEDLLHKIVQKAKDFREWQLPMATRAALPPSVARELAQYVDASVRDVLMTRSDFDPETTEELSAIFRRRMDFIAMRERSQSPITERISRIAAQGGLTDEALGDALAVRDTAFVYGALARLIGVAQDVVEDIFDTASPKPIVALCWRAGLSMRTALILQKDLGRVSPKRLLYPREGVDYPLTEGEMLWQLDFLGLPRPRKVALH